jgi:hypothetical protein
MEKSTNRYGYIDQLIKMINKERKISLLPKEEQINYIILEMCIFLYGQRNTDYINKNMLHIEHLCYFLYDLQDGNINIKTLKYIPKEINDENKKDDCKICHDEKMNCNQCKDYIKLKSPKKHDKKCDIV